MILVLKALMLQRPNIPFSPFDLSLTAAGSCLAADWMLLTLWDNAA